MLNLIDRIGSYIADNGLFYCIVLIVFLMLLNIVRYYVQF